MFTVREKRERITCAVSVRACVYCVCVVFAHAQPLTIASSAVSCLQTHEAWRSLRHVAAGVAGGVGRAADGANLHRHDVQHPQRRLHTVSVGPCTTRLM